MKSKIPPANGGAVQEVSEPREQVVSMLAPEPEKDFVESLPESTTQPLIEKQKRTRRTRAEMEAARASGEAPARPGSDSVTDERLEKCRRKFAGMGGGGIVKSAFSAAKRPLAKDEETDVEDYFYMLSAKGGIDPMKNWFTMFFTLFMLLLRLVITRTDMFDKVKEMLFPAEKTKTEAKEETA